MILRSLVTGVLLASALAACTSDAPTETTTSSTTTSGTGATGAGGGGLGGAGGGGTGGLGGSGGAACASGELVHAEDFDVDGAWPAPWTETGGVDEAAVEGGRARLRPVVSGYSLGRMKLAGAEGDVEATFTVAFDAAQTQGLGLYARQNGGWLQGTVPHGAGYAVFVEGFSGQPGIGVWYERDGVEVEIADAAFAVASGVRYRVRYRVTTETPTSTRLRARVWPEAETEPATWLVDVVDAQDHLQGVAAGFAVDAWSTYQPGAPPGTPPEVWFDDLVICRLGP